MSIVNECMVVNLQLGTWVGQRLDKAASQRVVEEANAAAGAARVNKHLISDEAMKAIKQAQNAVRTHFYTGTLPWKDNGDRVLSRKAYMRFIQRHEELTTAFYTAVDEFCTKVYPAEREKAEFRMGELFNPDDYPSARAIRQRFYVHLDIDPVAEAGDFRVQMDAGHADAIKASIEQALTDRVGRAMGHVWDRLAEVLGNFAERTKSGDGIRVELVQNLREIVDLLPEMNITNDAQLEGIRQQIEKRLIGYEAADLRKDDTARAKAAKDAQAIMDQMKGFMNAWGTAA